MTREKAKTILACRGNGYSEDEFNEAIEVAFNIIDEFSEAIEAASNRKFNKELLDNMKPLEPEIRALVNDNFWNLIGEQVDYDD